VAAITVNLLRTGGPGALNSIWIEDAHVFLNDAYAVPFRSEILLPWWGHFDVGPRIAGKIASLFPVGYAAPVLTLEAAAVWGTAAVIAFLASRAFLPHWWLRLLVAAPVVLVPVGRAQVDNDVSTVHFVALYALFWLLLWQPGRVGRVIGSVCAVLIGASSVLAVIFIPLAIIRMFVVRGWGNRLAVSLAFLAGNSIEVGGIATGQLNRGVNLTIAGALQTQQQFFTYLLPRTLFGDTWLGGPDVNVYGVGFPGCCRPNNTLVVISLVLLAAALLCAVVGLTRPHWVLAALAAAFSVGIFAEEVMVSAAPFPRYLVAPTLLWYVALVALLRPAWPGLPAAAPPTVGGTVADRSQPASPIPAAAASSTVDGRRPRHGAVPDRLVRWRALRAATGRVARWSAVPLVIFALLFAAAAADNYRTPNARTSGISWSDGVARGRQYCQGRPDQAVYVYASYWWRLRIPCSRLR
jgi:hypothetical protein